MSALPVMESESRLRYRRDFNDIYVAGKAVGFASAQSQIIAALRARGMTDAIDIVLMAEAQ